MIQNLSIEKNEMNSKKHILLAKHMKKPYLEKNILFYMQPLRYIFTFIAGIIILSSITTAGALAPTANFTADVFSGLAPLTVNFADESLNSPTGWAWYFGDQNPSEPWEEINSSAGWSKRYSHSSVVLPDGSIVLMGGNDGSYKNDVWKSIDNGTTWTEINSSAGWQGRFGHSSVVLPDSSIVLMGGSSSSGYKNDVWRSTDDGTTWKEINSNAGWSGRYVHTSVVLPDGSIVLMAGGNASSKKNDVWKSADNGTTWTEMNSSAGWSGRIVHSSVALSDGTIVLMGGLAGVYKNDVWKSTDSGATWIQVNSSAEWMERLGHSSVALPDDSIVLMGGRSVNFKNDVWKSTENGTTWTEINSSAGWTERLGHTSVVLHDGSIVLMGGRNTTNYKNDVWKLTTADSSQQNPPHVYTEPGIYKIALQAYNDVGCNRTLVTDYITVADTPVANFTADITSGVVPLVVNFTDLSNNTPTSWIWNFGDGTISTDQNPTHTYSIAGTYTVSLNATNIGSSNINTQENCIVVAGVPVANFTSNVTSGGVPLSVNFTDTSLNSPTGWTWYFDDEGFSEPWTEINSSAGWNGRYGHSSIVLPDGSIVLMGGGSPSGYENDVWKSIDNGTTWNMINPNAGWSGRYIHSSVVLPDGSIILMGGYNVSGMKNDVWKSTDNGTTWIEINSSAGWSERTGHSSVVLSDGSIVLMGGYDGSYKNDVWRSTNNGTTWTEINSSAGWQGRYIHTSITLPDGSIVLMGGGSSGVHNNDVWRSTDKGYTWTEINSSAGWSKRFGHSSVSLPDGSIMIMGGLDNSNTRKNDVWKSTDKGYTWTEVNSSAGWSGRICRNSVVLPDGSVVFMGGHDGSNFKNDVWHFGTAGSSEENPYHTYTASGTYQVTLQAYNAFGYNSTLVTDYITVAVAPITNFTANTTSGTAPLTVNFTDLSTNAPTSWEWDFGDGTTSIDQNSIHTYATAGTYNVILNATNAGGSNTIMQMNHINVISSSPVSTISSSSDNSGTRTSVSQGQNPKIVETTAASTLRIIKGTEVKYNFSDSGTPVVGVSFDAKDNKGLVVAKVQALSDSPEGIPRPSGTSHQLMSIDVGSAGTITTDNADNILIHFKVRKGWIREKNIDPTTIRMAHYNDKKWEELPTSKVREEDDFLYFTAETPGFSLFSIVGDEAIEVIDYVETVATKPVDKDINEPETTQDKNTSGFSALSGSILVSVAFLVSRRHHK